MLPDHWFDVIVQNPQMFNYEEAILDHIIIYQNCSATETESPSPSPDAPNNDQQLFVKIERTEPEQLKLPEDEHWNLYITNSVSTDEIWARIIGPEYSVRFTSFFLIECQINQSIHLSTGCYGIIDNRYRD